MKKTKIISAILAIVMLFSLFSIMTSAAEANGKITITNAIKDQTYSIYKLFDLESFSSENYCYTLEQGDTWYEFFNSGSGAAFVTIEDGMVTWDLTDDDAADLAELAIDYAKDTANGISPTETPIKATGTVVEFTGLELGYYLVDSTVGTLCALNTTDTEIEITDKNKFPTVTKKVKENSTQAFGTENDASIGDTVEFQATVYIAKGSTGLVLHDTLGVGFYFDEVNGITGGGITEDDYTVKTSSTCGCSFEVEFEDEFVEELTAGTELVVSYSAKVNANATIGTEGNKNVATLAYGEDDENKLYSTPSETITRVWEFGLFKYTGTNTALAGAKFALYADEAHKNLVKFSGSNNAYKHDLNGTVVNFTTDSTGAITFTGLDSGTYYLEEIEAPAGYNKLADDIVIEIGEDGKIKQDGEDATRIEVENKTGSRLPLTGGIGTYLFYGIGGILVLAAIVLLVTKKRMQDAK